MTLDEFRAELEAGQVRSSYLVVGAEPLLRDDALEAIRIAVLGDGPSDFDYERLDGEMITGAATLSVKHWSHWKIVAKPSSLSSRRRWTGAPAG